MVMGTSILMETQSIDDSQLRRKTNSSNTSDSLALLPYKAPTLEISTST